MQVSTTDPACASARSATSAKASRSRRWATTSGTSRASGRCSTRGSSRRHDIPLDLRTASHRRSIAWIGDLRNDANLITAQLHVAYLRFHNRVVERIRASPADFGVAGPQDPGLFDVARRLVRWHHQYLVLHDYLDRVTAPGTVTRMLADGPQHYRPLPDGELWTPLEFAAAAFRFGHSMIRDSYDLNRNHGLGSAKQATTTDLLLQYTGRGAERLPQNPLMSLMRPFEGRSEVLPADMVWEADRLCDQSGSSPARHARHIDWRISAPLGNLRNRLGEGADDDLRGLLRQLPQRNLLRGYVLSLPTGQAAAEALGVDPLSADELDAAVPSAARGRWLRGADAAVVLRPARGRDPGRRQPSRGDG